MVAMRQTARFESNGWPQPFSGSLNLINQREPVTRHRRELRLVALDDGQQLQHAKQGHVVGDWIWHFLFRQSLNQSLQGVEALTEKAVKRLLVASCGNGLSDCTLQISERKIDVGTRRKERVIQPRGLHL